jgi:dihydroorotase
LSIENAVINGVIDALATDHAPHGEIEKSKGFMDAPFGVTGFETFLASTYTHLVLKKKMPVLNWLNLVTLNPSRILGINRGFIAEGCRADIVIFDPLKSWVINKEFIISKSKNSPFIGMEFFGAVEYTISNGNVVYK